MCYHIYFLILLSFGWMWLLASYSGIWPSSRLTSSLSQLIGASGCEPNHKKLIHCYDMSRDVAWWQFGETNQLTAVDCWCALQFGTKMEYFESGISESFKFCLQTRFRSHLWIMLVVDGRKVSSPGVKCGSNACFSVFYTVGSFRMWNKTPSFRFFRPLNKSNRW